MPFFEKCDWDPQKNAQAVAEGRKSFAEMEPIFFQPNIHDALIIENYPDENTGERRFVLLHSLASDGKAYRVVFCQRDETTRIISASRIGTERVRKMDQDSETPKHNLARLCVTQDAFVGGATTANDDYPRL